MIVPSKSFDDVASNAAWRKSCVDVNDAVGLMFAGGPESGPAFRLSARSVGAPPVHVLDTKSMIPTSPCAWSTAGVALVFVKSHDAGSADPLRQTLACSVVSVVPATRNRTRSWSPGLTVRPGTVVVATMVCVLPTVRTRFATTEPPGM